MRRTTVLLDESLDSDLRALSRRLDRPLGALVREALARFVRSHAEATGANLDFIAVGRSGRSDVAERHEALLFAEVVTDSDAPGNRGASSTRGDGAPRRKPAGRRRART